MISGFLLHLFHIFYSGERSLSIFWRLFFKVLKSSPLKKLFTILSNSNKLSFLMITFFKISKNSFLNCFFILTSSFLSESYIQQSFPDFDSISFHGFYSREKLILFFWWFLFLSNPKIFLTVYSNSNQAVLPKTTSHILFQIFTPSLFMGSILEKN